MDELSPEQILKTIEEIEALARKLDDLLPEELILDMPYKTSLALHSVRQISLDIDRAIIMKGRHILYLRDMLDEQESVTR